MALSFVGQIKLSLCTKINSPQIEELPQDIRDIIVPPETTVCIEEDHR